MESMTITEEQCTNYTNWGQYVNKINELLFENIISLHIFKFLSLSTEPYNKTRDLGPECLTHATV